MRTTTLVLLAMVPTTLTGCSVGRGSDVARDVAGRFVEQVNTNTCDEASGFDIDDSTWTAACEATVADLAEGTSLSDPETTYGSVGEVQTTYTMISTYRNRNDEPTTLRIWLDGEGGLLSNDATLSSIASESEASIGDFLLPGYGRSADTIEYDGQALIEQVQYLLLEGNCDDIQGLMAPVDEFPDAAEFDECDAVASMYAAHAPASGDGIWYSRVYSTVGLMNKSGEEAYGIPRRSGESEFEYADRVIEAVGDTNRRVTFDVDPYLNIAAVLYEGRWYLSSVLISENAFNFRF